MSETIRLAGTYSGPSYGSADPRDGFEGFTSLREARTRYQERQETSGGYRLPVRRLKVDYDDKITGTEDERVYFPATTPEDVLDLYRVCDEHVAAEPFARLSAGPRGGVVREDY